MALGTEGAAVAVADMRADAARAVADEIRKAGGQAIAVVCDVSDRASVRRMKVEAEAALGPVSLLFANAGATHFNRMAEMSEDDVDWILQVNLMGVSNCVMAFLPRMLAARDGHVVATASMAGILPAWIPYHAPYSAAKLGVVGLMLNLRNEAAESGVGVTVLCPGGVATSMRNSPSYRPERFGGPSDEKVRRPEGFFQEVKLEFRPPEQVAQLVLRAVRENRPMVLTAGSCRRLLCGTYMDVVTEAVAQVEAFDRQAAGQRG